MNDLGKRLASVALIAIAVAVAGCSLLGGTGGSPGPSPTPVPSPTPGAKLTGAQLKLAVIDQLGGLWYCDPDFYPIAVQDEQTRALERFGEVQADAEAFAAILADLGLDAKTAFSDADKLAIYREWKVLNAIALESIGNDRYRFDYLAQPLANATEGTRTAGTIAIDGTIAVENQGPAGEPMCPICLARGQRIETPNGGTAVERLRIGDPVWTLDAAGRRILGAVTAVGSTVAPANHEVVRLVLDDGRTVTASPGHALADGRRLGDLRPGDLVGGSTVRSATLTAYRGGETFDIVVSGPTGLYLIDGIALRSTLQP